MRPRAALAILFFVATACTSGNDRAPVPPSTSSPVTEAPSNATPTQTLSRFGFPPVAVSPDHGPIGSRVSLVGDDFVRSEWRDVVRANAGGGYGVFLIKDLPDGCELIAGARFDLQVDASGHLTSDLTVPERGQCFQTERTERVRPGAYRVGIGCHACEVATFKVTARTRSFDACIGSAHGLCKDRALYLAGDRPHIIATIGSGSAGAIAGLWRRAPGGRWERVASVPVDASGHLGWQWVTTDEDARSHGAWSFLYRIPGRGRSDIVRVSIVAADM